MAQPHTALTNEGEGRPVDLNVMKRNMTIAKGFLDISLLSANANQLKNIINYGDQESVLFYLVLTGIIISLVLQVSTGILLILAERFDINKEEDQERSDWLNTVVICLIFIVLIINVFVASLGVDVIDPYLPPTHHNPNNLYGPAISTTADPNGVFKDLHG